MPPAHIGLVGCGLWGRAILRDLRALGARVSVAEPHPGRATLAREAGASLIVTQATDLPPSDAFVVATPAATHAAIVAALLDRGVPLLVEKPFTTDVQEAEALVARVGSRIFVGHVWRYHPGIELLGAIARSGELGPVMGVRSTRANWTSPRTDVDALWNLAPHDLTIAIEILGAIPDPRAALAERHDGRIVGLTALLGGDPWLVFDVSNRYADKRREVRLHARDGVASLTDPDAGWLEIVHGDARSAPGAIRVERRPWAAGSALTRELQAFLAYLSGGPPPKSPAEEGLRVVSAVARLRDLARQAAPSRPGRRGAPGASGSRRRAR